MLERVVKFVAACLAIAAVAWALAWYSAQFYIQGYCERVEATGG